MNYKDVAVLNDSLDSMGQMLLRKKMLDEQTKERQAQTGLASQRLATDQAFRQAQQTHYNSMESKAADANTLAQQRATAEEDQGMVKTFASLNASGALTPESRGNINEWLSKHPRLGVVGLQFAEPSRTSPQAGQSAQAQLAQQIAITSDQMENATTDAHRAVASANYDFLTRIRDAQVKAAENPKAAKVDRTIKVVTGTKPGTIGAPADASEVTQEFTPEEYQAYQSRQLQNSPPAPTDPRLRRAGSAYKLPNGKVGTWTGQGWQLSP